MGGQFQTESPDGSHRVTIGSTDDPKYGDDAYFITQQDNEGHHLTSIFNSEDELIGESEKGKGI